jgi:multiple sugar transport system permease protein
VADLVDLFSRDNGVFLRWMINSVAYATVPGGRGAAGDAAATPCEVQVPRAKLTFGLVLGAVFVLQPPCGADLPAAGDQWAQRQSAGRDPASMISPIGVY